MASTAQQTFIDRLNSAEAGLADLAAFADHLSNRLVGYAGEEIRKDQDGLAGGGLLKNVGDAADRMSSRVNDIRVSLNRIMQILPPEVEVAPESYIDRLAGQGRDWA